ncbi:MAG TPA: alanine racemase [Thermoanaerobaculia bacterium]|nr:alanine racemase [Thermoanaerobaculia bacterium]
MRIGDRLSSLRHLPTPCFLVDLPTVERNTRIMREKAFRSGVRLRPHVKTHKTVEGARVQLGAASGPITVSTMAEAEFFAAADFRDVTYAVPIAADKFQRALALASRIDHLGLLVEGEESFSALESFAMSQRARFEVFLKIDCGYHRAGVDPESEETMRLIQRITQSEGVVFKGLLTHAGHSYHAHNREELLVTAREEVRSVAELSRRMKAGGLPDVITSIGSTPTMSVSDTIDNVDEIRPGNYIFFDAFQAAIGSCAIDDCGVSVLTSVIGKNELQGKLLIDAGALALSKDRGADHLSPDFSYGLVADLDLGLLPFRITALSQEHGILIAPEGFDLSRFPVGAKLRVLPNHSCLTAAMFDVYHVIGGGEVVAEWRPCRGW